MCGGESTTFSIKNWLLVFPTRCPFKLVQQMVFFCKLQTYKNIKVELRFNYAWCFFQRKETTEVHILILREFKLCVCVWTLWRHICLLKFHRRNDNESKLDALLSHMWMRCHIKENTKKSIYFCLCVVLIHVHKKVVCLSKNLQLLYLSISRWFKKIDTHVSKCRSSLTK